MGTGPLYVRMCICAEILMYSLIFCYIVWNVYYMHINAMNSPINQTLFAPSYQCTNFIDVQ